MSKRAEEAQVSAILPESIISYAKEHAVLSGLVYREGVKYGYEQAERDLGWHSVKEMLPQMDEEVIVLTDDIHGTIVPGAHGICFGHRPNPDGWDGKNMETGEVKHYDVVTYDGWNIPGVTHWMYCPKLEKE